MRKLLVLIFCALALRAAADETDSVKHFSFEALSFETQPFSRDSARVDIYVAVPYSILKFLNAVDKYVADYSVNIVVTSSAPDTSSHTIDDTRTIVLSSSEMEKLDELQLERANASQHTIFLRQGTNYTIRITVQDISTKRRYSEHGTFMTKTFFSDAPGMSDALLYRSKFGSRIVPLIGSDISSLESGSSGSFFELYNIGQSVPLWFVQQLRESESKEILSKMTTVLVGSGAKRMPVFVETDFDDLWRGTYVLEQYLFPTADDTALSSADEQRKSALSSSEKIVEVRAARGIPIAGMKIEDAIEQLLMIASGNAHDSLTSAETTQEKRSAIVDFWRRMKPYQSVNYNRPMQVFYRRVQYANKTFRTSVDGWRTDRGRMYIQLGEPTFIDKRPYEANSRPYEMWEYSDLNVRFYFVDQFMVNDYRLVSAAPPNGIFNWQRE